MKTNLTLQDLDLLLQLLEIGIDKHQEEMINTPYSHVHYHSEVIDRYRELEKKIKTTKQESIFNFK